MASVSKRPNGKYLARWREYPGGPQKTKTFDKKGDADDYLVGVRHDQLTGRYVDPVLGKTSFASVVARYIDDGAWRDRTRETALIRLQPAVTKFGGRPVASLRKGELQAFLNGLPWAPTTITVARQHLSAALELAVEERMIAVNPARKLKVPKRNTGAVKPLAKDELAALIDGAEPWFRIAIVLGAGLGLRLGEAAGLTVGHIDFLRRTVRVDQQWQQPSTAHPGKFAPPKTEASIRTIPASDDVLNAIAAHLSPNADKASHVVQLNGSPLSARKWEYEFRRARAQAGLPDAVTFHSLRHYFASALIGGGCSVKAVQSALGHASAAMTLDVYGHLWPGDEDRIRAAISLDFESAEDRLRTTRAKKA